MATDTDISTNTSDGFDSETSSIYLDIGDQDVSGLPLVSLCEDSTHQLCAAHAPTTTTPEIYPSDVERALIDAVSEFVATINSLVVSSKKTHVSDESIAKFVSIAQQGIGSSLFGKAIAFKSKNPELTTLVRNTTRWVSSWGLDIVLFLGCQKDPNALLRNIGEFPSRRKSTVRTAFMVYSAISIIQQTLLGVWNATFDENVLGIFYRLGVHYGPLLAVMTKAIAHRDDVYDEVAVSIPPWSLYAPDALPGLVCIASDLHIAKISPHAESIMVSFGESDFAVVEEDVDNDVDLQRFDNTVESKRKMRNLRDSESKVCLFGETTISFDIRRSIQTVYRGDDVNAQIKQQSSSINLLDTMYSEPTGSFEKSIGFRNGVVMMVDKENNTLSPTRAPNGVFAWISSFLSDPYAHVVDYRVSRPFWSTLPIRPHPAATNTQEEDDDNKKVECDAYAKLKIAGNTRMESQSSSALALGSFLMDAAYIQHLYECELFVPNIALLNDRRHYAKKDGLYVDGNSSIIDTWAKSCGLVDSSAIEMTMLQTRVSASRTTMDGIRLHQHCDREIRSLLAPPPVNMCFLGIAPGVAIFSSRGDAKYVEGEIVQTALLGGSPLLDQADAESILLEACLRRSNDIYIITRLSLVR